MSLLFIGNHQYLDHSASISLVIIFTRLLAVFIGKTVQYFLPSNFLSPMSMILWTYLIMADESKEKTYYSLKRTLNYQEASSSITSLPHLSATEMLVCRLQFSYFYMSDFVFLLKASDISA